MRIRVRGAREHNLQGIDVTFGDGLTVVTGVSGSGKTSLVFDTVYHEARRRFLEVFSFGSPGLLPAPADVEEITGLVPTLALGQNLLNRNPASTVATAAGLHPYLRLLYARFGERGCPACGAAIAVLSEDEIVERIVAAATPAAPGEHAESGAARRGGVAPSGLGTIPEEPGEIPPVRSGPMASHAAAPDGVTVYAPLLAGVPGSHRTLLGLLAGQFDPAAIRVDGRGLDAGLDGGPDGLHLDPAAGHDVAVAVGRWAGPVPAAEARHAVRTAAALGATAISVEAGGVRPCWPVPRSARPAAPGSTISSPSISRCPAPIAGGPRAAAATAAAPACIRPRPRCAGRGYGCPTCWRSPLTRLAGLFAEGPAASAARLPASAARLREEITRRLEALAAVGLGYLALDRPSPTLSRGESQRVRLAVALAGRIEDMLHVLDEPTIGLHPVDVARLLPAFRQLRGPTIFVEHDRVAAAGADHAVDLGPGAGHEGGRLLYSGPPAGLWEADTPTGRYFSLRRRAALPRRRPAPERFLVVRGAHLRNLAGIDVPIPLARLTVISGVSGSGKSTLVEGVLMASLADGEPAGCRALEGPPLAAILVDQDPIGTNPRSNPATYTGLADLIRDAFAAATGLSPSHFSFNRPEGACPECAGMGAVEVSMRYLPSSWVPCAACGGTRFSDEVLAATAVFDGRRLSIADFYQLSVAEAAALLPRAEGLTAKARAAAGRILEALADVGLGYLPLGQPSPDLSGGEAQRVKLARYLGRGGAGRQADRARRAVDRAAPTGRRGAAGRPRPAGPPRGHGRGGRAQRRHHPRRRLGRRPGSWRRPAGRPTDLRRPGGGPACRTRLAHRPRPGRRGVPRARGGRGSPAIPRRA